MKTNLYYFALLFLFTLTDFGLSAQDTLVIRPFSIEVSGKNSAPVYKVDGKQVTRAYYESQQKNQLWMDKCPVTVMVYAANNVLSKEYTLCGVCWIGKFKEYNPNGKVKLEGEYETPPSMAIELKNCFVKTGSWKYYSKEGVIERVEFYKKNELTKTDKYVNGVISKALDVTSPDKK